MLAQTREERLRKNITAYRHTWMIAKTRALTTQGSDIAKAIALHVLMEHLTDGWKRKPDEYGDQLAKDIARAAGQHKAEEDDDYRGLRQMSDYLHVPARQLDGFLHRAALAYAHQQDDDWPNTIIDALDIDDTKEFALTTEYLDLYSKDQLLTLAKHAKVSLTKDDVAKKGTLMDAMLKRTPTGFVPKDFRKAREVTA